MLITNKNIKTWFLICLCSLGLGTGCKKLVQIDPPQNSIDNAGEFASDAQAKTAMAGLYTQISLPSYCSGGATIAGGLSSDELEVVTGPLTQDDFELQKNRIHVANATTVGLWNSMYQNIYTTNSILENLPGAVNLSDAVKNELTGEAKFARAFFYFYLLNNFGDVPIVLTTDFNKTAKLPRIALSLVYKQVVNDLLDAQTILPSDYRISAGNRTIPNKLAATALLARTYLYQQDWKNAEAQATLLINNPMLNLNSDLKNVFLKSSQETIWQLEINNKSPAFTAPLENHSFIPNVVFSDSPEDVQELILADYENFKVNIIAAYMLRPELLSAFEVDDQRKSAWIGYAKSPESPPYNGVITYFPYKYKEIQNNASVINEFYVVFRLAEQYLLRAEARAEQGNIAGAAEDLNKIRSRAGLPNTSASTQTTVLAAIMQERRVEFFAEWGHRWFDLKRSGQIAKALSIFPDKIPFSTNSLLYPIPLTDIAKDPFLVQNPGY